MPRPPRYTPPDSVLHLVNRGNDRKLVFESAPDFDAFLDLPEETQARYPLRLLAPGPLPLPATWVDLVNQSLPTEVLELVRTRMNRTKAYDLRQMRRKRAETATKST